MVALAAVVGVLSAVVALVLLQLITLATNLAYFQDGAPSCAPRRATGSVCWRRSSPAGWPGGGADGQVVGAGAGSMLGALAVGVVAGMTAWIITRPSTAPRTLQEAADPLDVVAGHRWAGGGDRRLGGAAGARGGLRRHRGRAGRAGMRRQRLLPVVHDGALVGVVPWNDILERAAGGEVMGQVGDLMYRKRGGLVPGRDVAGDRRSDGHDRPRRAAGGGTGQRTPAARHPDQLRPARRSGAQPPRGATAGAGAAAAGRPPPPAPGQGPCAGPRRSRSGWPPTLTRPRAWLFRSCVGESQQCHSQTQERVDRGPPGTNQRAFTATKRAGNTRSAASRGPPTDDRSGWRWTAAIPPGC